MLEGLKSHSTNLGTIYLPQDTVKSIVFSRIPGYAHAYRSVGYSKEDSLQDRKFGYKYKFMFRDSSFLYMGIGPYGDLRLTDHYDTVLTSDGKYRLNLTRFDADGVVTYIFDDSGYFEDRWYDPLTGNLNKQIAYKRKHYGGEWCCSYFVAGYRCPISADTAKYEKSIRSISWKSWNVIPLEEYK